MLSRNSTRSLLRRLLDPSFKTLFTISFITFCGFAYLAYPHRGFLIEGSIGEAKIITKLSSTKEHTKYEARLAGSHITKESGIIISDRPSLAPGDKVPVFFRRDDLTKMLIIELFAPWVQSLWLLVASLAAFGLGLRERDKQVQQ